MKRLTDRDEQDQIAARANEGLAGWLRVSRDLFGRPEGPVRTL
jgi:hypothetical protein